MKLDKETFLNIAEKQAEQARINKAIKANRKEQARIKGLTKLERDLLIIKKWSL